MSSLASLETREMTFWNVETIGMTLGGRWIVPPETIGAAGIAARGVGTDSRAIVPGQVFIALRGEKFDGHDYLEQAAAGQHCS
jgi:UDP-N-acetylmuramyl pentapeptide synthase